MSSAEQRAIRNRDSAIVARVADVYSAIPSMTGKFELEYEGEMRGADNIARELIRAAVGKMFTQYFTDANFQPVMQWFELGGELKVPANASSAELLAQLKKIQGLFDHLSARRVALRTTPRLDQRRRVHSGRSVGAQAHQPQRRARLFCRSAQDARTARSARAFRRPHAAAAI